MIVASISTLFTLYAKDMHLYQNFIGRDASNLAKPYTVMGSSVGYRGVPPLRTLPEGLQEGRTDVQHWNFKANVT